MSAFRHITGSIVELTFETGKHGRVVRFNASAKRHGDDDEAVWTAYTRPGVGRVALQTISGAYDGAVDYSGPVEHTAEYFVISTTGRPEDGQKAPFGGEVRFDDNDLAIARALWSDLA